MEGSSFYNNVYNSGQIFLPIKLLQFCYVLSFILLILCFIQNAYPVGFDKIRNLSGIIFLNILIFFKILFNCFLFDKIFYRFFTF